MSRKNNIVKYQIITSGDMSTASLTSAVTNVQFLDNIGIQLNFTGTPTGSFAVQVSADYAQDDYGNVTNTGNWVSLALSPAPSASGAADTAYVDIIQTSAPWIRTVYTRVSGTGTLNAFITAKMIG